MSGSKKESRDGALPNEGARGDSHGSREPLGQVGAAQRPESEQEQQGSQGSQSSLEQEHSQRAAGSESHSGAFPQEKDAHRASHPLSEEELVEAAIRAGEAAAERDMKADADRVAAQNAQLAANEELEQIRKELEQAQKKAESAEDRLLRLQSDWENYRRRTANERLAERERATEKLVEKLLPIVDDMERALAHALKDGGAASDSTKDLADGVSAIHTKLLKVFETENVEVIDPAGTAFDPLEHQAVGRVEDAQRYEDTVCDVYQRGYKMAKKVIRPAMVTVSFGGKKRPEAPDETDQAESSGTPGTSEAPGSGSAEAHQPHASDGGGDTSAAE